MNIKTIMILCLALVTITTAVYAIPDNQCHKMASNKDKAVAHSAEFSSQGHWFNPCTGVDEGWKSYRTYRNGVTNLRTVYTSGDSRGYLGLTEYVVCTDGRARITQRIAAGYYAMGWGAWLNFPHEGYVKEICNTL